MQPALWVQSNAGLVVLPASWVARGAERPKPTTCRRSDTSPAAELWAWQNPWSTFNPLRTGTVRGPGLTSGAAFAAQPRDGGPQDAGEGFEFQIGDSPFLAFDAAED